MEGKVGRDGLSDTSETGNKTHHCQREGPKDLDEGCSRCVYFSTGERARRETGLDGTVKVCERVSETGP